MEPPVQFAKTDDGIAIAYWSLGKGAAFIHMPWLPWSHAQLEYRIVELARWYDLLAESLRVVRYDGRLSGLSQGETEDLGLEAQIRDLEAVIERLGVDKVALFAVFHMGPAAITYASRHPDRVSHLILWCTYARGSDYYLSPQVHAIRALIDDWQLYTETGAHAWVGWSSGPMAHEVATLMRSAVRPEVAKGFFASMSDVDCSHLLAGLAVPTMVLHPREFPLVDLSLAQKLAAAIPGAHLVVVEGSSLAPTRVDSDAVCVAITDFLGRGSDAAAAVQPVKDDSTRENLTERELQVLILIARGESNRGIADELVLSIRTVERHAANIYSKLGISRRSQAAVYALNHHLL